MSTIALVYQEPTYAARTGTAFYFTYEQPTRRESFRVVELNTGVNLTHEGRYSVWFMRPNGWTQVVGDVGATGPQAALEVALDVLILDH